MKLMIIESPGKVEKLSAILGPDWKVAASVGHIRDLPEREMGVEAPAYKPQYVLTERGGEVVARLKGLVRRADEVYLATDPDREGESISWHLQQCLELRNPYRVTFGEVTAQAVKAAIAQPRAIDVKRVAAQEARRVLDRLVGYTVSPQLCQQTGERLSAGRVQSPAVRLVVERERAIRAFKSTLHYGAALDFADAKTGAQWTAEWQTKPDFVNEDSPYFMDRDFAAAVAEVRDVQVIEFADTEKRRSPPGAFTTSTLQQAASVALGMDPGPTMQAAQSLFDAGHITYHRTDNPNVSEESLGDIYAVATRLGLEMAEEPRKFKTAEAAQAGHPACTPTHWEVEDAGNTVEQRALYRLIRKRAIACQLADARYAVRTATLEAVGGVQGKPVQFHATGRTLIDAGWLGLTQGDQTQEDEEPEVANPLPELTVGQDVAADDGRILAKKTKAPPRYTQASLVAKLESEGIGRPATYAAIMENIVARNYVRRDKKFLVPTPTGELVVDSLVGTYTFVDLDYTRGVEAELDRIANGEAAYRAVIERVHQQLQSEVATVVPRFACPDCGKALVHRVKKAKKGGYDFWGCSGYHDGCKASFNSKGDAPDFDTKKQGK